MPKAAKCISVVVLALQTISCNVEEPPEEGYQEETSSELVQNGGLEADYIDYIGWLALASGSDSDALFSVTQDEVHEGSNAFLAHIINAGNNPWDIEAGVNNVPVNQGVHYRFSAWVKSTGASKVTFTALMMGAPWTHFGTATVDANQSWQNVKFDIVITEDINILRLHAFLSYEQNEGQLIYMDSFSFKELIGSNIAGD